MEIVLFLKRALSEVWFRVILIRVWAFEMVVPLIRRDKLLIQCVYCLQTEPKTSPLTFKADGSEDAGSLVCLCSLLRFDCPAKLFNRLWNHKKAVVLHCPQTELLLMAACRFCYLGPGGRAQPCESAAAWWPKASLYCAGEQSHMLGKLERGEAWRPNTHAKLWNIWNLCGLCGKTLTMWLLYLRWPCEQACPGLCVCVCVRGQG